MGIGKAHCLSHIAPSLSLAPLILRREKNNHQFLYATHNYSSTNNDRRQYLSTRFSLDAQRRWRTDQNAPSAHLVIPHHYAAGDPSPRHSVWVHRVGTAEKAYLQWSAGLDDCPLSEDEKASAYSDIVGILNSTGMPQIMASIEEVRQAGGKVDPLGQKGVEETLHAMEGQRQKQKDGQ